MSWREQPRDRLGRWTEYSKLDYIYNSDSPRIQLDGGNDKEAPTPISDKAILSVPFVHPDGCSLEEAYIIREQHRELLKYAREHNNEREVAFVFREGLKDRTVIHGDATSVNMTYALNGKGYNILVMHNHPMNSPFSDNDIKFFVSNEQIKTISVVKHNGHVELISKTETFTVAKAKVALLRAIRHFTNNKINAEMDRAIRYFLLNNGGMLQWISK